MLVFRDIFFYIYRRFRIPVPLIYPFSCPFI